MPYDHACSLPILGLPVRFEASDAGLLQAALAGYGAWRDVALSLPHASGVRLRIGWLDDDSSRPDDGIEPSILVSGSRISVSGPGLRGAADYATGFASCSVAGWLAGDPQRLATDLLDTLLLFMLTRRNRVPLHAAGIVRDGVAALLCAPSGVGKSTLALAAARAGWKLLSDDAVYLETLNGGRVRVWGWPRAVYLAPGSAAALDGDRARSAAGGGSGVPLRLRNGKWKDAHVLPGAWATPPVAEAGVLVLLERGDTRAAARRIGRHAAGAQLLRSLDAGFDVWRGVLAPRVRRLATLGAWRLSVSSDVRETLAAVTECIENADSQSATATAYPLSFPRTSALGRPS